jgi:hypothetical protein
MIANWFFAVAHTWELLEKLKKDYYAAWHDERPGGTAHLTDLSARAHARPYPVGTENQVSKKLRRRARNVVSRRRLSLGP